MEWILLPLKRYADFRGRSGRKEYWLFSLATLLVYALLGGLLAYAGAFVPKYGEDPSILTMLVFSLVFLSVVALIVPGIAVEVRRFHDQDRSGWLVLLGLIPYVGFLIVLIFMCLPGTKGPNRFGADPYDSDTEKRLNEVFG